MYGEQVNEWAWVLFHSFCYPKIQGPKYIDSVFTASYLNVYDYIIIM